MHIEDRWLLPEGIQEALPKQAAWLECYRRKLLDLYASWGYELVMPSLIEYLESLLVGDSQELDLQTFKLTDQLNGRLMGVRADMSPQVARIDAHMLKRDVPTRLCYMGTVLRTRPDGLNGSRAPLQVGAEIYGHAGIDSDVEIIRLMLETLRATSVDNVHLDLGHAGIYWNLARQSALSDAQTSALFEMLQRKALPEIQQFLNEASLPEDIYDMLLELADLSGGEEVLERATLSLRHASSEVHESLDYLQKVADRIKVHVPQIELHFDLAELRGYHYENGIVFAAYVPGRGQEIARGGRYDEIGEVFGRARPATGFSTDLHTLMNLSSDNMPGIAAGIYVKTNEDAEQRKKVLALRIAGERVVYELENQLGDASTMNCDRELILQNKEWVTRPL